MLNIAIVEDEASYTEQLTRYLDRYAGQTGESFHITTYSDGDEIVEHYQCNFDIILMDVQMPFLDGMSAAEAIRKCDAEVIILFITNMAQYAIRGYAVDALDYLLKPVSYFAFSQRLDRAIQRLRRRSSRSLMIPIRGGTQKIELSQLYYVESQRHALLFHTASGVHTSSGTMQELEEKLVPQHFYRISKGYLINLEHVSAVQDGCAVVHGIPLPISRARKNEFMETLTNFIGEAI